MMISVNIFNDHDRTFGQAWVDPWCVVAVGPLHTQHGAGGAFPVRQVWTRGGHWFFLSDEGGTLLQKLTDARSSPQFSARA